jgi:hypothetical protein
MDLCGRCLIILNATTAVRADIPREGGRIDVEHAACATDPVSLKKWAERVLQLGGRITVDATTGRFEPLSTWHGDPVCSVHLWTLAEAEMRNGYGWKGR